MPRRRGPAARPGVIIQGAGHTITGAGWPQDAPGCSLEPSTAIPGPKPPTDTSDVLAPVWAAMSEAEFQNEHVRPALEERGFVVWVVPNMQLTAAGLPDILAWNPKLPGLLLALELKRERDARITPAQVAALAHLETVRGIEARILRPSGWPKLRDTLDLMLRHGIVAGGER